MRFIQRSAAILLLLLGGAHAGAHAEPYPQGPVTVVVPFTAGGGSDNVARLISDRLSARLGQPFVVDNKPGASTNLGNELVARARPDGRTLLLGQVTLSINPTLMPGLKYDVMRDYVGVAHIGDAPVVLVTSTDFPARDLPSLVRYVREHPGKTNFASGGVGTSVHLAGELFKARAGVDMLHIPYRGSTQMVTDLIGGQIHMIFNTAPSVVQFVKAGKLRAIAVSGARRLDELPDVPTFAEAGMPDFDAPSWYGLMAPAGTAPEVVERLNATVEDILREPAVRAALTRIGVEPVGGGVPAFAAFLRAQQKMWGDVIRTAHVKIDN
ncbi:tripartite tricarboxylate transporter substrate binding protein [Pigmentiphaga soli]|uniref:Tripartite tricarboxylate transporter substrate binding protein n=1 Tax=Pigmentiphaga soli TaxID=1007095 RepID=A0ABP8GKV9_9BURK